MYHVTYMTPTSGKWKWSFSVQWLVDKEDALLHVDVPQVLESGALLDITVSETLTILAKFDHLTL